jgi:hypothetical protein
MCRGLSHLNNAVNSLLLGGEKRYDTAVHILFNKEN